MGFNSYHIDAVHYGGRCVSMAVEGWRVEAPATTIVSWRCRPGRFRCDAGPIHLE